MVVSSCALTSRSETLSLIMVSKPAFLSHLRILKTSVCSFLSFPPSEKNSLSLCVLQAYPKTENRRIGVLPRTTKDLVVRFARSMNQQTHPLCSYQVRTLTGRNTALRLQSVKSCIYYGEVGIVRRSARETPSQVPFNGDIPALDTKGQCLPISL